MYTHSINKEGSGTQTADSKGETIMTMPSLELFTQPHVRRHAGNSKWGEFFGNMEVNEIKVLPEELQEKKSLHGYVPKDIRTEFVFRTNPEDGKRYVARLAPQDKPARASHNAPQRPQEARSASKNLKVVSKSIDTENEDSEASQQEVVEAVVPGKPKRVNPPKQFDAE